MIFTSSFEASSRSACQNTSSRSFAGVPIIPLSRHFLLGAPKNLKSFIPNSSIASFNSISRCSPSLSSLSLAKFASSFTKTSPSSPRVQVTKVTCAPNAAYLAIVTPLLMVSSSGWAWTNNNLFAALTRTI